MYIRLEGPFMGEDVLSTILLLILSFSLVIKDMRIFYILKFFSLSVKSCCKTFLVVFLVLYICVCVCMYVRPQPLADHELVCERYLSSQDGS